MHPAETSWPRRAVLLGGLAAPIAWWTTPGAFADELTRTPKQTEGPFYPNKLPLDTDNDLLIINDQLTPAIGTITHLSGQVVDLAGKPVTNACVEIWQCDHNGAYLHTGSSNRDARDANFQGFGRFVTGRSGEYYFRTIQPVPYPGRTPHIHFKIKRGGKTILVTQMYIQGHPDNQKDGLYKSISDPKQRDNVTVAFNALPGSKIGEKTAEFQIVVGLTPPENPG